MAVASGKTRPTTNPSEWRIAERTLSFDDGALIMGVLNTTPDSFSDGGRFFHTDDALSHALAMADAGAAIHAAAKRSRALVIILIPCPRPIGIGPVLRHIHPARLAAIERHAI